MHAKRTLLRRMHLFSPIMRHVLLRSSTSALYLSSSAAPAVHGQHYGYGHNAPWTPSSSSASSSDPSSATALPKSPTSAPASTVDPTELAHFARLASSWWDPHGSSRLLHLMNPLRHRFIARCLSGQADASSALLSPSTPSLHYLDVGCGGGIFAESAARLRHTASVTALDPSPEVLTIAKAHMRSDPMLVQSGKLAYKNLAIEELSPPSPVEQEGYIDVGGAGRKGGYDIVTLFEVLEHVSTPADFLYHLTRQVKPGGWLIVSTIARTWTSWATTKLVAEDILRMVPRGTHDWDKYINESELRNWFMKEKGNVEWDVSGARCMGVVYVPGFGWKEVDGSERWGNYFFGIRRRN